MDRGLVQGVPIGLAFLVAATVGASELPAEHLAADVLPAHLVSGPYHRVVDPVHSDGYLNIYRVESDYGSFSAVSTPSLRTLIREIEALAELEAVSKTAVFAKAAAEAGVGVVTSLAGVIIHPVDSAKSVPQGLSRMFSRGVRVAKRGGRVVSDTVTGDAADDPESMKVRNSQVSDAEREWSRKLGVDPYSHNQKLRQSVTEVARVASVTGFAVGVALPVGLMATSDLFGELTDEIWSQTPQGLRTTSDARLAEAGFDDAERTAILDSVWFTPTQLAVVSRAMLDLDGVQNRPDATSAIVGVDSYPEADFVTRSLATLAWFEANQDSVERLDVTGQIISGLTTDGIQVVPLTLDYLYWTTDLEQAVAGVKIQDARGHKMLISGNASPMATEALIAAGWQLQTGVQPDQ